ncbi:hypothetical protein ACHAXT_006783 [Thalassiosira profunda]
MADSSASSSEAPQKLETETRAQARSGRRGMTTGFNVLVSECAQTYALPDDANGEDRKLQFAYAGHLAGNWWKDMTEEEKSDYRERANDINASREEGEEQFNEAPQKLETVHHLKGKTSAFKLMVVEYTRRWKESNPNSSAADRQIAMIKCTKEASADWKNLSADEREVYQERAKEENERRANEASEANQAPPPPPKNHGPLKGKTTGFNVYYSEMYERLKQNDPVDDGASKQDKQNHLKVLRAKVFADWKTMSESKKSRYKLEAEKRNEEVEQQQQHDAPSDDGGREEAGDGEGQLDHVLNVVLARSRGEVGNDAVEKALSSIVAEHAPSKSTASGSGDAATATARANKDNIIPDEGNYDDSDDDALAPKAAASKPTKANNLPMKRAAPTNKNCPRRQEALDNIPLGKMGERMIVTFGDGPVPNADAIAAALLGTRASLQRAILDARALRRRQKDKWHQARAEATMYRASAASQEMKKTTTGVPSAVADNELSFKAMDGNSDNLRFDVPCGFDVSQLDVLFPEEMGAYQRWKKMHDEYEENSEEVPKKTAGECEDGEGTEKPASAEEAINSQRLTERLANFDARTTGMGEDWYLQFADVRRGSFLPRSGGANNTKEWRAKSGGQNKKRGRPAKNRVSWINLHPSSVVFLHWIGFDPTSALSPPNEETTQALGFLAYDFFGKIVEKAVSLRLERGTSKGANWQSAPLIELTGGDQLSKENIDRAIAETDLKSLCSSSNVDLGNSAKITQLYFGPGFEERLELEMDELFGGSKEKSLSQGELDARKEEENLFSQLPDTPALLSNVADLLPLSQNDGATKKGRNE